MYIIIWHRNHLGIMCSNGLPLAGLTSINFPISDDAEITARASYSFTDDFADGNTDDLNTQIPGHEVVDARVAYNNLRHHFEIALWIQNAFDETYRIQAFDVAGSGFALFALPRTYGVTFRKTFD